CRPRSRRALLPLRLDGSLDCRHLDAHDAPNPAFENAAWDRAHDVLEVDLDPHHRVGLPFADRLALPSPARRARAHPPGERHAAWRLDGGHALGPGASRTEYALRPLSQPRAELKRAPSVNPAFAHRRRPLLPASDVANICPHFGDAAG